MDNPLFFVAVIGIVIVLVVVAPKWIRRSTRSAADRARLRLEGPRFDEALDELGTQISLDAPPAVLREIIDAIALQQPRRFTVLSDGSYGIRFIEPDDAIVRLVEGARGTRVRVEVFREYMGMPSGSGFWSDLRARIAATAASRGIHVDELDERMRFQRGDGETITWTVSDEG